MIEVEKILLVISSTLFLSYISNLFYVKTRISDLIWLLGFGILLGPVLGYLDKKPFILVSPLIGVFSLCIITFGSGISLELSVLREILFKTLVLTIGSFVAITVSIGLLISYLIPQSFSLLEGMLLGTMVAGISTVAITSLLDNLQNEFNNIHSIRNILALESTLVDPLRFVAAITIIRMLMYSNDLVQTSMQIIVFTFLASLILGGLIGLLWATVLNRLRGRPFNYMLTLATLFPIYYLGESVAGNGGGTLSIFIFGFVLSNYRFLVRLFGVDLSLRVDTQRLIEFNNEVTFFLKSYYFVYIGLIVIVTYNSILLGLGMVVLILSVRYIVATGISHLLDFSQEEKVISRLTFILGTSTLVMTQLPILFDSEQIYFQNSEIYSEICFPIVLGTLIFSAVISPLILKRQLK